MHRSTAQNCLCFLAHSQALFYFQININDLIGPKGPENINYTNVKYRSTIWCATHEKGHCAIFGQRRPKSACAFAYDISFFFFFFFFFHVAHHIQFANLIEKHPTSYHKFWTIDPKSLFHYLVTFLKTARSAVNSVRRLIWMFAVCSGLSVPILRVNTVYVYCMLDRDHWYSILLKINLCFQRVQSTFSTTVL